MKKKRQAEILAIIKENCIENQDMLIQRLSEKGYNVTQATVSRDINELGLIKSVSDEGVNCYSQATRLHTGRFENIFQQSIISIDHAQNIVCLKCHSGLANAACATFDIMDLSYVVGTIAGDDTVFILVRTEKDAENLCDRLRKML